MEQLKLNEMNLLEFGNEILLGGIIYSGKGKNFICLIPNEADISDEFCILNLSMEEWKQVLKQTDLKETEILQQANDGKLVKAIVRKSARIIEQGITWKVFHRDGYRCRYCGKQGIPMTVDHLVLWEDGGPSIEENLLTSCRRCNKTRGNTLYPDWLNSSYYGKVSVNLTQEVRDLNLSLVDTLDQIPVRVHVKSR